MLIIFARKPGKAIKMPVDKKIPNKELAYC
jgi:hypothetical protein